MSSDNLDHIDEPKPLTKKQIRFAQSYARTLNGALAAREAGVKPENSARTAHRWLNNDRYAHVLQYVDELLADDAAQRKIDHDLLRQRLRSRLSVDQRDYWDDDGKPVNPRHLSEDMAQHVKSYTYSEFCTFDKEGRTVQEGCNASVNLSSDTKAEELLGRHSGFFTREQASNQFDDYLQADSSLEDMLSELEDEYEDDEEEAAEEAAGGDC